MRVPYALARLFRSRPVIGKPTCDGCCDRVVVYPLLRKAFDYAFVLFVGFDGDIAFDLDKIAFAAKLGVFAAKPKRRGQ